MIVIKGLWRTWKSSLMKALNWLQKSSRIFLNSRQIARKRYIEIMKTSIRPSRWIEVKRILRIITDVSDKQLSNYLKELTYYGFIEKNNDLYFISDPLLVEAIRRDYVR
jgi:NAD dependent epimerase/dehydratase family enzyme